MKNENPKISVIVPVYNAEKYLKRCIDSILNQTFTDFEVLLINDGSTDSSAIICDEYAKQDSRIRVFHKDNGGVSSARQLGINLAKGLYSIHVDSDDYIALNMLEIMYYEMKTNNLDIILTNFYKQNKKMVFVNNIQKPSDVNSRLSLIQDLIYSKLHGSLCNKLVRHSLYKEFNIECPLNVNYSEDLLVVAQLFIIPDLKISYIEKSFYYYCYNAKSLTNLKDINLVKNLVSFTEYFIQILAPNPLFDNIINIVKCNLKISMFNSLYFTRAFLYQIYPEVNYQIMRKEKISNIKKIKLLAIETPILYMPIRVAVFVISLFR